MAQEAIEDPGSMGDGDARVARGSRLLGPRRVPGLAAFLERAPAPAAREAGSAEASTEEDLSLLAEFARLRRDANSDIE